MLLAGPFSWLFLVSMVLGVVISISANTWFAAWCGLELNLMSFIPFVMSSNNFYSSDGVLKYFLIQVLGSSTIVFMFSTGMIFTEWTEIVISLALLLKLGAAPFHMWLPQVMESLPWSHCFILMTIQKIAPMFLLTRLINDPTACMMLLMSGFMSALVGGIGGLNQRQLRSLLAYSSISHMSWMLLAALSSETTWFMYFSIYAVMVGSLVVQFAFFQMYHMHQLINFSDPLASMSCFLSLFSLGGLPPFLGFLPKLILIEVLINKGLWVFLAILLLGSLLSLFYYMWVGLLAFFSTNSVKMKWTVKFSSSWYLPFTLVNFMGVLVPSVYMVLKLLN